MKSKTSLYNSALGKSLFKRFWPLWVIWFWALIFILPINLSTEIGNILKHGSFDAAFQINSALINYGIALVCFAAVICPLTVLLLFSFLYTSRSSGMIASLPIKRECVFTTFFLTGLVPLLLAELITVLVTVVMCGGSGFVDNGVLMKCLWMLVFSTVAFYGMAVFCAVLTGNIVVLPFAYSLLGVAPYLAYAGIGSTLQALLYGFSFHESELFRKLSPFIGLESLYAESDRIVENGIAYSRNLRVYNGDLLGWYCIAGIVLSVVALLLYRKRAMESAGDIVAVKVLKPVFKYCAALAGACIFAPFMYAMFYEGSFNGASAGIRTVVSLVIGGFIGYFAAQMLLDRSLRVFHGHWKGFIVFTLIILVLAVGCECDMFGFERYVPDAEEVESVTLYYSMDTEYKEPENIEKITELHRQIIDSKKNNELVTADIDYLGIGYTLKNGKTLTRSYTINRELNGESSPDLYAIESVINVPEAVNSRVALPEGLTADDIIDCMIYGYYVNSCGEQETQSFSLSPKQAAQFYESCILPDAADGHMARLWPVQGEEYNANRSTLRIEFRFDNLDRYESIRWKEFIIYMDAERCCQWITENTNLVLQSLGDVQKLTEPTPVPAPR
ncbi:MAG: hypothetical protein Q4E35_03775 [Eubacteriales bacterium]|nr:hypothetical protein [Eubacteriales bacterium]